MKTVKYIFAAMVMLAVAACAKPDEDFVHTDSAISGIEIQPAGGGEAIAGIIDETTGEIFFPIPKAKRERFDVTSLTVRANVQYDAIVYPSLSGLKDLSDPDNRFEITVTAGDKGSRTYTLWAFYERRTE